MKRSILRVATAGIAGAVVAGLALVGALPSSAAPNQYAPSIGYATAAGSLTQSTGGAAFNVIGSTACPAGTGLINAYVDSPTWTTAGVGVLVIGANSTQVAQLTTTGVTWDNSLANLAAAAGKTIVNGTYTFSLICFPNAFASATNQLDGTFTVTGTTIVWAALPAPASTTTLAASAASITTGGSTTLTATVTPATAAGTVQFVNGTTNLGAPVAVAAGKAATTVTGAALGTGADSITAVFTPTNPAVLGASTSAPLVVTVTGVAAATTTTLTAAPAAPTTASVVTLTAALSPTSAVGTVTFTETSSTPPTVVGTAAVTGGAATASVTGLAVGTHTYTAAFTPTNAANYTASTSAAVSVPVVAFTGSTATETLTTTIGAGTLTISASTTPVNLGAATLNAANTLLVTAPVTISNVTVTDTRAGSIGYTVSGQASNFVSGANVINSENLGWTPAVVSGPAGVTAGPVVAPAAGVSPTDPGTAGLKSSRVLAVAAAGGSIGTAVVNASLLLQAPTTTPAGTYNSTLTLTAI